VTGAPPVEFTSNRWRNQVGSYRRTFQLPDSWSDRLTFLHFDGVDSAYKVWVNEHEIGFAKDSRTPADFDITQYLVPGENLLAVEVFQYSDGSYVEDQDKWRLSGIFREVYLWTANTLYLRDLEVKADLDADYVDGIFDVKATLRNTTNGEQKTRVRLELLSAEANAALHEEVVEVMVNAGEEGVARCAGRLPHAVKWSAESPALYLLVVSLHDSSENLAEITTIRFPPMSGSKSEIPRVPCNTSRRSGRRKPTCTARCTLSQPTWKAMRKTLLRTVH
jgi:beta-galactosidase